MNLKALMYAVEVARLESFTAAARSLHVAQPALSMAITRLEEELGVDLFNRAGRQIGVTDEGRKFLSEVEQSLFILHQAKKQLVDHASPNSSVVRIGFSQMHSPDFLSVLIHKFTCLHPGVVLEVLEGTALEVSGLLDAGKIDIAVVESRLVRDCWEDIKLGQTTLVLGVASHHPLAKVGCVRPRDLDGLPMLLHDQRYLQRRTLDEYCDRNNVRYIGIFESNCPGLLLECALRGTGAIALIGTKGGGQDGIVKLPFEGAPISEFSVAWVGGAYISDESRCFLHYVSVVGVVEGGSVGGIV